MRIAVSITDPAADGSRRRCNQSQPARIGRVFRAGKTFSQHGVKNAAIRVIQLKEVDTARHIIGECFHRRPEIVGQKRGSRKS